MPASAVGCIMGGGDSVSVGNAGQIMSIKPACPFLWRETLYLSSKTVSKFVLCSKERLYLSLSSLYILHTSLWGQGKNNDRLVPWSQKCKTAVENCLTIENTQGKEVTGMTLNSVAWATRGKHGRRNRRRKCGLMWVSEPKWWRTWHNESSVSQGRNTKSYMAVVNL